MAIPRYTKGQMFGPYKIDEILGAGSFAEVWSAWRTGLGGWHALKILHGNITKAATIKRFRTEARAMYELSNAKDSRAELIVRVTDMSDEASSTHWMAMERLRGMDLEKFCSAHTISFHESLRIARDIALALQFAHQRTIAGELSPIYHRDLKPGNVFRTESGTIKVGDWGLAHVAHLENEEGGGSVVDHGTVVGLKMGTPGFTAPEQWKDITNISGSADVYSLGVILAVLVADFYPGQKGEFELYEPEVQKTTLDGVPSGIHSIIVAACNVFPKQRPSVDEMIRLLEAAMNDEKKRLDESSTEESAFILRPGFEAPATVPSPSPPKSPAASPTLTPAPSKAQPTSEVNYGTRLDDPPSFGKWIIGGAIGVAALLIGAIGFWQTGQPNKPAADLAPAEVVVEAVPDPAVVPVEVPVEVKPKEEPKPEASAVPIMKIEPVPVKKVEAKPKVDPKPVETVPIVKTVVTEVSVSILHTESSVKAGETVSIKAKVLLPEGATVKSAKLYWKGDAPGAAYQNKPVTITGGLIETSIVANPTLGGNVSFYIDTRIEGDSKAHKSAVATTAITQ